MASLSLPRVLQLKKNSLDAEREQFEKFQTLAIQKAINSIETPVKEKHVRSTLIGTFQEQSAITYWMVAVRLPLQDNRIVAWKFCHVTHKLLREGHPACLDDSQRHVPMIENLGKLWVHLREGYGKLVHLYCTLLVCKLRFHARNPRFPPNMHLTADELDAIAENDVNNYFQLCVELFDYMDDILTLQAAVFDSLGNARANSMTASGQCRLAALIPCAQDSSQIYDCNVRLLFRLHASLPPDTLAGHRDRFRQQFKKLSQFYKHASSLQYYRNLLTLPVLPSNPPNFLLQSDFGTYVAPVVTIPEPSPEDLDTVGSLIDTSDTVSQATSPDLVDSPLESRTTPSPQPDPVLERDRLIDHLQNELKRMRSEVSQLVQERSTMVGSMREHCSRLESQLHATKTELDEERQKAELLSAQTPEIKQKLTETEEKAKVTDEKFQKLKGAYTQLREEHIKLIRQKAEVDKMAASLRAAAAEHESAKMALQQQLNDKVKDVELLQQSASTSEEIEAYKSEIANLRSDIEHSRLKEVQLETLRATFEALEIEHKTATTESEEKLSIVTNELKDVKENLENIRKEKEDREVELCRLKEDLVGLKEKSGEQYTKAVEEKEAALKQIEILSEQYQQEKQEHEKRMVFLQSDLETLQFKLNEVEANFKDEHDKRFTEVTKRNKQFDEILLEKDCDITAALLKLHDLEKEFEKHKSDHKEQFQTELLNKDNEISTLKEEITKLIQKSEERQRKISEDLEPKITELSDLVTAKELEIRDRYNEISETNVIAETLKIELKCLSDSIIVLKSTIEAKDFEIQELHSKFHKTCEITEQHNSQSEAKIKEISSINDKLQNTLDAKNELINDLKKSQNEKDERIITLSVEANSLANSVGKLEEELNERNAELEIAKNELVNLEEEHKFIVLKNENNVSMKNEESRRLNDEITKLTEENTKLLVEKEVTANHLNDQKQVFEGKVKSVEESFEKLKTEYELIVTQKAEVEKNYEEEIKRLIFNHEEVTVTKDSEIQELTVKIEEEQKRYSDKITEKQLYILQLHSNIEELKAQLDEVNKLKSVEKQEFDNIISEKNQELQMLDRRLKHVETEKLTAECELQDLLQHNTLLENSVATLKQQLEEAQKQISIERSSIIQCAGDAALEVTNLALSSLERGNSQDSNRAATQLAAKAFEELAAKQVSGNEESLARSAILAAHSTAQLSTYVTEVTNTSTDVDLSDKLTHECRTMLDVTRQCMESLRSGAVEAAGAAAEAGRRVQGLLGATAAADTLNAGPRSVDDELADMDRAIEEAAGQIESILAASRKGDSGVKLEVNGKILDACTTLMGAVKILVQDARRLQHELGDPSTRQNMYRRNPQWSEGLISAAKAVVFAAKLLVSSADEAVGASGRVEGVSAAAHEVAGSTAQLVAASRARAPPSSPALARLTQASRSVAAATGAVVAAVRAGSALVNEQEALDTSALSLTATRILEMECKVRSLELETALDAERARLAALRKRHYQLQQEEENGITNGKE